jgi:hypothetical protein
MRSNFSRRFSFLNLFCLQNDRTYGTTGKLEWPERRESCKHRKSRNDWNHQCANILSLYWRIEAPSVEGRCGPNSWPELRKSFELADYFQVWIASPFALRWFGAQLNRRIISKKVKLIVYYFCDNKREGPPPKKKKLNQSHKIILIRASFIFGIFLRVTVTQGDSRAA